MSTLCKKLVLVQIQNGEYGWNPCASMIILIPHLRRFFTFFILHSEIDEFVLSRIFGDLVLFSHPYNRAIKRRVLSCLFSVAERLTPLIDAKNSRGPQFFRLIWLRFFT